MIICTPDNPGTSGGLYVLPYVEGVDGKRHGYRHPKGYVQWTRKATHPADPRCPQCAKTRKDTPR